MNQRVAHKICKSISIADTIGRFDADGVYIVTSLKPYVTYTYLQFCEAARKEFKFYQRAFSENKRQVKNRHCNAL